MKIIATIPKLRGAKIGSFAKVTPKICGATIKGIRIVVASGFVICLLEGPKDFISRNRIVNWWKCKRSGKCRGLPRALRRHIANSVSHTGQKKISSMANGLIELSMCIK